MAANVKAGLKLLGVVMTQGLHSPGKKIVKAIMNDLGFTDYRHLISVIWLQI